MVEDALVKKIMEDNALVEYALVVVAHEGAVEEAVVELLLHMRVRLRKLWLSCCCT